MSSFRNPNIDDRSKFYPPTTFGQTKGYRTTKNIPRKRRRKTNLRAMGRREEALTMPYRTATQVKKKPSIYQTANDFLSIHQQSLINSQRDNREVQRLETAEEKKLKQEQLELQKRTIALQEQQVQIQGVQKTQQLAIEDKKVSNDRLRDKERARSDRVKEVNRRGERQEELGIQKTQTENQRQLQNAFLYQQGEQARKQAQLESDNRHLRMLEQHKEFNINQENNRSRERLAELEYSKQNNINRANERIFTEFSQTLNNRVADGERRQGEVERIGRDIIDKLEQQRTPQFDTTIPDLRTFQDVTTPFPSPIAEPIRLPDKSPSNPVVRTLSSGSIEFEGYPPDEPPKQEGLTSIPTPSPNPRYSLDYDKPRDPSQSPPFKPKVGGGVSTGIASRMDRLNESQNSLSTSGREEIEKLRSMVTKPSPIRPTPKEPEPEPERIRSPTIPPTSPLQLATPREEVQRSSSLRDRPIGLEGGLGGAVSEGIQAGGGLVLDTIGSGLRAGADLGVGVAQGVGGAVYDATIGQLPTANEVGNALGRGAIATAGNVASEVGRVGGLAVEGVLGSPTISPEDLPSPPVEEEEDDDLIPTAVEQSDTKRTLPQPQPEPEEDFEIVEEEQLQELPDVSPNDPVRIQARLEEYNQLVGYSDKQKDYPKNFDDLPNHYRLVVLEDIQPQELGRQRTQLPFKKGDQYRLQRTDYQGQTGANQGYYFYRDNTGTQMAPKNSNLFKLNLKKQDKKIRKLIEDGKLKIVLDEFD